MENKKINIGIVGCGNIAEKYLEQIRHHENYKNMFKTINKYLR